jgi:two-component system, chemotaxis family, chemotaxis protein CheY
MEPMSGLQPLKEVRADTRLAKVAFVMVTAESKTENVVAAQAAGLRTYIVKPFNAVTLKQKIEAVVGALREQCVLLNRLTTGFRSDQWSASSM